MGKGRRECHLSLKLHRLMILEEVGEEEAGKGRKVCHLSWRHGMSETHFQEEVEEVEEDKDRRVCHLSLR